MVVVSPARNGGNAMPPAVFPAEARRTEAAPAKADDRRRADTPAPQPDHGELERPYEHIVLGYN
jgi:hypothetical protein